MTGRTSLSMWPEGAAVVHYLIANGPSTACEMRESGLIVSQSLIFKLHIDGYIMKCKGTKKGRTIWRSNL